MTPIVIPPGPAVCQLGWSVSRCTTGIVGFVDETVFMGFMLADALDPFPNPVPKRLLQTSRRADLLDERVEGLRQLAVLVEQFLDFPSEPRRLLQDRRHVTALLLETEMREQ